MDCDFIFISHILSCQWSIIADSWRSRWVESNHKSDYGKFVLTAGKFYGDADKDKGECCIVKLIVKLYAN